jgi:hypothetical protein
MNTSNVFSDGKDSELKKSIVDSELKKSIVSVDLSKPVAKFKKKNEIEDDLNDEDDLMGNLNDDEDEPIHNQGISPLKGTVETPLKVNKANAVAKADSSSEKKQTIE